MSRVYSTLLNAEQPASGLFYTVPAGYTAVVVDALWVSTDASGTFAALLDGDNVVVCADPDFGPADGGAYISHWTGRQVLNPGDTLTVATDCEALSMRVSGYLLTP